MSGETRHLDELAADGVRWQVQSEYRQCLFGPNGFRLGEWLGTGQAVIVKHGPHRTVYRVCLPDLCFHLKHYRLHDTRAFLREMVRPPKARMEYDRALAVAARHIPTIVPLAVGERASVVRPGDSFLITRSLVGVEPLGSFLEATLPKLAPARQAWLRRRLAVELARFVAQMHDGGILHHDFHPGNLLFQLGCNDELNLYLVDLHAVQVGDAPLRWEACRANLVILNRWFSMRGGRSDRLRFWRSYCRCRATPVLRSGAGDGPGREAECRERARDLEQRTWASNQRFWRSRDHRCRVNNRYYQRVRSGSTSGYAVRDLDRPALLALLADPDAPFRRPGAHLVKDSPSTTVVELDISVGGTTHQTIYKRFRVTKSSDPWVALVRTSAALRSWVQGQGLRERSLPTARPLAVFHRHRRGLPGEGYLLTERIPEAVELNRFVAKLGEQTVATRQPVVRRLIEQVARLVRELHRRNLSHRDLKATNLLVQALRPGDTLSAADFGDPSFGRLWLIDLVGVRRHRKLGRSRKVQNLARLHASFCQNPMLTRTDKLRFVRVYLQWGLFGQAGWKDWWHEIEQATHAKIERNRRSGRPLA